MVRHTLALAVALLVPLALSADDKFTIKVSKDEMTGDRLHVTRTETAINNSTIKAADGTVIQDQKRVDEKQLTYEETIVEKAAGKRPSNLSRKYEAVTVKTNGTAEDTELAGKTVVVERKDGKHQFKLDGGTLSPAATRLLAGDFKDGSDEESMFEKNMLPKTPVAVGDTWKCNLPDLVKDFTKASGSKIDADKATGTGKLLKVYDKDGKKFGTLEVTVELPVTELKGGPGVLKMDAGSRFKVTIHYDGCIDGSRTQGTIKFGMALNGSTKIDRPDGATWSVVIATNNNRTETVKELGKK